MMMVVIGGLVVRLRPSPDELAGDGVVGALLRGRRSRGGVLLGGRVEGGCGEEGALKLREECWAVTPETHTDTIMSHQYECCGASGSTLTMNGSERPRSGDPGLNLTRSHLPIPFPISLQLIFLCIFTVLSD